MAGDGAWPSVELNHLFAYVLEIFKKAFDRPSAANRNSASAAEFISLID